MLSEHNPQYISLLEASKLTGYSQEYLSLRVRQAKLMGVKLGRNWVTTKDWVNDYVASTKLSNGNNKKAEVVSASLGIEGQKVSSKERIKLVVSEDKKFVSLHDASQYAGHSQDYLNLRIRQKKLKAVKLGRNWVTTKEWIDEYLLKTYRAKNHLQAAPVEFIPETIFVPEAHVSEAVGVVAEAKKEKIFASLFSFLRLPLSGVQAFSALATIFVVLGLSYFYFAKPQVNLQPRINLIAHFASENSQKAVLSAKRLNDKIQEMGGSLMERYASGTIDKAIVRSLFKTNNYLYNVSALTESAVSWLEAGLNDGFKLSSQGLAKIQKVPESFLLKMRVGISEISDVMLTALAEFNDGINNGFAVLARYRKQGITNAYITAVNHISVPIAAISNNIKDISVQFGQYFTEDSNSIKLFTSGKIQNIKLVLENGFKVVLGKTKMAPQTFLSRVRKPFIVLGVFINRDIHALMTESLQGVELLSKKMVKEMVLTSENTAGVRDILLNFRLAGNSLTLRLENAVSKTMGLFANNFKDVGSGLATRIFNTWSALADNIRGIPARFAALFQKKEKLAIQQEEIILPKAEQEGLVAIPSSGKEKDEELKEKIRTSFSDEVKIKQTDADSGIIVPVFKEKEGENYLYLMVPVKNN